ncbi:nucleotidyltransferase domain-containing protein [Bacillus sp. ISL-75]|nr:nucleotidyltransferase domain-containing protein [Bacillus sp. ISL-75]
MLYNPLLTNNILEKAQEFLISKINPSFIIVFGSFANGITHKESDIDLAFYKKERNLSSYEVFMLAQELADILKMDVDLVDLTHDSTVFQAQIFSTGKVIFSNDETLRMNIEMTALSMYAKLNEERKLIIENVDASGTIYENDVILNKISVIERSKKRILDVYDQNPENLKDYTKQDSIILNIQRACEACIDLAMHSSSTTARITTNQS